MRWLAILAFFCVFSACNALTTKPKKETNLVLKAIYKGTYDTSLDTCCYCLVEIKLVNNTDTLCEFVAYSCTTSFNILTDSKDVGILVNNCSSNYPTTITVKPNQTFTIPIILQTKNRSVGNNWPIKFGLVLFKPKESDPFSFHSAVLKMKQTKENVIWSDPVILYPAGGDPYEVEDN